MIARDEVAVSRTAIYTMLTVPSHAAIHQSAPCYRTTPQCPFKLLFGGLGLPEG